jgi:hypothetical protein
MRNPDRLDCLYEMIKEIHKSKYFDLRFLQFVEILQHWISSEKKRDSFYIEDYELIDLIEEFATKFSK